MRVVVVYESMFGNTRKVAEAIAAGLSAQHEVTVVPISAAADAVADAELIVVGGPTHVHGMSRPRSRAAAADVARQPSKRVTLEPGAEGSGLREWLSSSGCAISSDFAAFDTRMRGPAFFTGRASRGIDRMLRRCGAHRVAQPTSFLVTKDNRLPAGEIERARAWGERIGQTVRTSTEQRLPT